MADLNEMNAAVRQLYPDMHRIPLDYAPDFGCSKRPRWFKLVSILTEFGTSNTEFPMGSRFLHWVTATLVLPQLCDFISGVAHRHRTG